MTRVLVVEPYEGIRGLFEAALKQRGHHVLTVHDGAGAIAALEQGSYACVIIGSPIRVKAGPGDMLLLEYIEKHRPNSCGCVIVVTTHVDSRRVLSVAARLEVYAVFAKPFTPSEFVDVIEDCIAGRGTPTRWFGIPETPSGGFVPNARA